MPHLGTFAAPLAALLLATVGASAAPREAAPSSAPAAPPPLADAPPAPKPKPSAAKGSAPASDAIPGAQKVMPPPDCPNGTLRTALGDLVCR